MQKRCEKHSYARSYPQYTQKSTTSVVYGTGCQGRKFVLGFVIKSQKNTKIKVSLLNTTFLDKSKINEKIFGKCSLEKETDIVLKK